MAEQPVDDSDDRKGDDRPAVYVENIDGVDVVVYRASALGGCERALVAARVGATRHPVPAVIQNAFDEGHRNEPIIMGRFADDHTGQMRLIPNGENQRQVQIPVIWSGKRKTSQPIMVRGSLDGLAIGVSGDLKGKKIVVDAKAFSTSNFDRMLRDPSKLPFWDHYITQQMLYARGVGADWAVLAICEKLGGTVEPESRCHYHWIDVAGEQGRWDEVVSKVRAVEKVAAKILPRVEEGQLPEEQKEVQAIACPCDFACQYPQFHDPVDDIVEIRGDDLSTMKEIASLDRRIREITVELDNLKANRKELAEKMCATYGNKFRGGGIKVTWVHQEIAEQTRVIKAHVRDYPKFTADDSSDKFDWGT